MRRKLRIAILVAGLVVASITVPAAMAATTTGVQPAAGPTIAQLKARIAKGCTKVSKGNFKTDDDASRATVSICKAGSAFVWTADMDVDCDSSRFSYTKAGIRPGTTAAIIFKNRMVYAVFADEGPSNIIGEASYATNRDLGVNPDPSNGGTDGPVTYIVFPNAKPSPVESNSAITSKGSSAATAWVNS